MHTTASREVQFTGKSLWEVETPLGVLIGITALPTKGNDGLLRVGGVGQSHMDRMWETLIMQEAHFDVGQETRRIVAPHIRDWKGIPEELPDKLMLEELKRRAENGDYSIDHSVDEASIEFAIRVLAERGEGSLVVVASKLLPLLLNQHREKLQGVIPLMIGIDAVDEIATKRKMEYENGKLERTKQLDYHTVAQYRRKRYLQDKEKYRIAYPSLRYCRKSLLNQSHVIFDNSIERNPEDLDMVLADAFTQMAEHFPQLQPFWEKIF